MASSFSKWEQQLRRLASMGGGEFYDRVRQQVTARMDAVRYGLNRSFDPGLGTVPPEVPHFFFSTQSISGLCSLLKQRLPHESKQIIERAERICRHRFDLLGYEDLDYGAEIDWHLDLVHQKRAPRKPWFKIRYLDFDQVGDSKVTWELNRHQHFVTLAKAYRLTGREEFASEIFRQWHHWHAENPYPIGINWASSLEVAFRSLSWIWMYFLLIGSSAMPPSFRAEWARSLGVSGRHIECYLSTYFSANTHLLGEGLALFFIGTLCPELKDASRWRQRGWDILRSEACRQVRTDGMHFEQSTYYHVYALDMFLHASLLAAVNQMPASHELDQTIERMFEVLLILGRAGTPPSFGDDDGGRLFDPRRNRTEHLLDPLSTGAVLFGRGDFKHLAGTLREETLWLLGDQGVTEFDKLPLQEPSFHSVALQASGFYAMADASRKQQLVIDCGPQGEASAGHGHADALSICVNSAGRPLLIDPGTCEYVGPGLDRDLFRLTAAHNTISVNGKSQSDPKGPFAWMRLARATAEAWVNGESFDLFIGSQDGYIRLPQPVIHRRWIVHKKSQFWFMRDIILGEGAHQLDVFWHLHPSLTIKDGGGAFLDESGTDGLQIITANGHGWFEPHEESWWSPAYGSKQSAPVVHFSTVAELPAEFVTLLQPVSASKGERGVLRKLVTDAFVHGYRYSTQDEDHFIFCARPGTIWSHGPWKTDSEFFYWGQSRAGRRELIACQATSVESQGETILSSPHPVLRCEIVRDGKDVRVYCSSEEAVIRKESLPTRDVGAEAEMASSQPGSNQGKP